MLLLHSMAPAVGDPFFNYPMDVGYDSYVNSVYLVDVNEDGLDDMVVGEGNGQGITIYYGRQDGSIGAPYRPAAGFGGTNGMVFGDFDGDSVLDIVGANANTNMIGFWKGTGSGTFATRVDRFSGNLGEWLQTADLNEDGNADFILVGMGSTSVVRMMGNGDGTTSDPEYTALGSYGRGLAVGDFNGDSHVDFAVALDQLNTIRVVLTDGAGGSLQELSMAAGDRPYSVAAGDLNGDGILDLVAPAYGDGTVSVLFGNGDGTFAPMQSFSTGPYPVEIMLEDMTGDGILDVVTLNRFTPQAVYLLDGDGSGGFGAARVLTPLSDEPTGFDVGDFNGDGITDFVVSLDQAKSTLFLGLGPGTYQQLPILDYPVANLGPAIIGDLNNDGRDDVLIPRQSANGIHAYLSSGATGPLVGPTVIPSGPNPRGGIIADVNGDQVADFYSLQWSPYAVVLRYGIGGGALGAETEYPLSSLPEKILYGDVNGDSIKDVVVVSQSSPQVTTYIADATGALVSSTTMTYAGISSRSTLGDFNGDNIADFAAAGTSSVLLSLGNVSGAFPLPTAIPVDPVVQVVAKDVNGDGFDDLVLVGSGTGGYSVMISNGDGTFATPVNYPTAGMIQARSMVLQDVTGDGVPDMVGVSNLGSVVLLPGNSDGTFQAARAFSAPTYTYSAAVADVDGDGNRDIVVQVDNGHAVLYSALEPGVTPPAASLDFGATELSDTPATLALQVENSGAGAVVLTSVTLTDDGNGTFSIVDFPAIIPGNSTGTITVGFQPAAMTSYSGELQITTNDVNAPGFDVALSGSGVDTIAPSSQATGPDGTVALAGTSFDVEWTAADSPGGSGVATVELFYSFNGGGYTSFGPMTSSPVTFDTATRGGSGTYSFYTVATDAASNVEAAPGTADITVNFSQLTTVEDWFTLAED